MKKFKKILLVDDNEIVSFYNEDLISDTQLFEEIIVITNGTDAIEYFQSVIDKREDMPELTLLDIKMPDYDGFEVLEELEDMMVKLEEEGASEYLEKIKTMQVCMLTTSQHKRDLELFENSSLLAEYLEKPLTPEKLTEVINKHLKR